MLESMADSGDLEARTRMFDALDKLVTLHRDIRGEKGLVRIQGFILPMVRHPPLWVVSRGTILMCRILPHSFTALILS